MTDSVRSRTTSCVNSVINLFQENPYDFLSKREIQTLLHSYLKTFIKETITLPHPSGDRSREEWIRTSIIRSEYPAIGRFDISVIHPEIGRKKNNNDLWDQPLLGAIDLEFCKAGEPFYKTLHSFIWKMDRFHGFKDTSKNKSLFQFGLALLFSQTGLSLTSESPLQIGEVSEIEEVSGITGYIVDDKSTYRVSSSHWEGH